ncbi:MAG: EscV/YscV/HrcV family type III secretion system export apparatus protein, partial [Mesorhizobium sp.]
AFGGGAYLIRRQSPKPDALEASLPIAAPQEHMLSDASAGGDIETLQSSFRIIARLGHGLGSAITEPDFSAHANRVRRDLFRDLGVDVPAIGFHIDETLAPQRLRIDLEGAPVLEAEIPAGCVLVEEDEAHLDLIGVAYEAGPPVAGRPNTIWVDEAKIAILKEGGLSFLLPAETSAKWTSYALRLYAGHFVGIQETRRLLSDMEQDYADLVKEAQDAVSLQKIAEVLRRLVAENVPIRNLRLILEALIEWGRREQDVVLLTEHVRSALKRQISFRSADRNNIIAAYVLQRSAEDVVRAAVQSSPTGTFLDLSGDDTQALVAQIERALAQASAGALPAVLTTADVRRHMRSLLVHHGLELPVLSYQELSSEFNVQPLATITGGSLQNGRQTSHSLPAGRAENGAIP